jgi:hypothetical protein
MKETFRITRFKPETLQRIEQANAIISEYGGQKLTARQVYYRFVAADLIPNTPRSYQNLTSILTDARYAGLVDWDAIEDRGREPDVPGEWDTIDEIVDAAVNQWRSPRWTDQPKYVELWVEKQALAGVLSPIARRWHVPLMVNKGYSSASAMKAAADRMLEAVGAEEVRTSCAGCGAMADDRVTGSRKCGDCGEDAGVAVRALNADGDTSFDKEVVVVYLGDHDPSGEDMVRDIRDRLVEFGVPNLKVDKVALTMPQIKRFKPPPNPAKVTDSRAKAYIAKYGDQSWELDALPPRELNRLVEQAITRNVDKELMDAVIAREDAERERVRAAILKSRGG